MTVAELIEELRKYPGGMRVVVDGYEGGLCDTFTDKVSARPIRLNEASENEWWYGPHEKCLEHEKDEIALLIER